MCHEEEMALKTNLALTCVDFCSGCRFLTEKRTLHSSRPDIKVYIRRQYGGLVSREKMVSIRRSRDVRELPQLLQIDARIQKTGVFPYRG